MENCRQHDAVRMVPCVTSCDSGIVQNEPNFCMHKQKRLVLRSIGTKGQYLQSGIEKKLDLRKSVQKWTPKKQLITLIAVTHRLIGSGWNFAQILYSLMSTNYQKSAHLEIPHHRWSTKSSGFLRNSLLNVVFRFLKRHFFLSLMDASSFCSYS